MFILETVKKGTKTIIKKIPVTFYIRVSSPKLFLIIHLLSFSVVYFQEPCALLREFRVGNITFS